MNIIPKLNLNRNPKDIPSGSLVAAKNMMVDDTGSYFTNEYGFKVSFECPNEGEYICGVIPTNKELVIFTYCNITQTSRIYRYSDRIYKECNLGWNYSGGKITGSYTYNYKGELIIAVGEYDAKDFYGKSIQVPYKCWNLDNCINVEHNQEEEINKFDTNYSLIPGSLVCGVYTFFIRFAVSDEDYTKWFQISPDIIIIQSISKEVPTHTYLFSDKKENLSVKNYSDSDTDANNALMFNVNTNNISDKGICLHIDNLANSKFKKYQIGYIIKHDEEVLGRIQNTYNINNNYSTVVNIINNNFSEEESIDKFLENPNQLYNVKNIINYNNRIYLSNYEEYKNQLITPSVITNIMSKDIPKSDTIYEDNYYVISGQININETARSVFNEKVNLDKDKYVIIDYKNFIIDYIVKPTTVKRNDGAYTKSIYESIVTPVPPYVTGDVTSIITDFELRLEPSDKNTSNIRTIYTSVNKSVINVTEVYIKDKEIHIVVGNLDFNISSKDYWSLRMIMTNRTTTGSFKTVMYLGKNEGIYDLANDPGWTPSRHSYKTNIDNIVNERRKYTVDNSNINRSLIPHQRYNIFIHYIRKDGSYTNGYNIGVSSIYGASVNLDIKYFNFKVSNIPSDYIGYFFSYENIEYNSIPVISIDNTSESGRTKFTNSAYIYNNEPIFGNILAPDKDITNKLFSNNKNCTPNLTIDGSIGPGYIQYILSLNNDQYNKRNKTLYRLTKNYYTTDINITDTDYIPNFCNKEKVVSFTDSRGRVISLIFSATSSKVVSERGNEINYYIKLFNNYIYSINCLEAYNVKQDYSKGAVSLVNIEGKTEGVFYNSVLSPDKLHDFLEIKSAYTAKPSKTFTNYNDSYINKFDKTIRRSNVISDESLVNGFRIFKSDEYKIIKENKGDITNIVGVGLYLLVHTQYSLFVFDRSPKLTQSSQLQIPDAFDIDYQEVLPSNEGFGGLWDKEEAIISKNGYIWYDKVNKYIFKYENGKASVLSSDINNFIKDLDIDTIRFGEDLMTNRLLICIYITSNNISYTLTLSYNFNTNTFISMHDYSFTNCYRTYNDAYFFDSNKDKCRLYQFDKESNKYYNLVTTKSLYYPIL